MSFSKPFYPSGRANYRKRQITGYDDDKAYEALHWTKQLELRPLRNRQRYEYAEGDRNTRLDQDWDENTNEHKETT